MYGKGHLVFGVLFPMIGGICFICFWVPIVGGIDVYCPVVARFKDSLRRDFGNVEIFWSNEKDFHITKRLGSGSFGEAYLGHNISNPAGQQYVIKVYRFGKMKVKKMLREILVTQSVCGHPNIIRLLHVIKQSLTDYPALVFEYARNTMPYHEMYPTFTPEMVRYYAYELLRGIAFAHEKGVMHKDLKPHNVMIDTDKRVLKIIDWGLAKFYEQREEQTIAGTLFYKSPEMLMKYKYATYSTDIWSIGCMFGAWFFRKRIFFEGHSKQPGADLTEYDQLRAIMKIMGTGAYDELSARLSTSNSYNSSAIISASRSTSSRSSSNNNPSSSHRSNNDDDDDDDRGFGENSFPLLPVPWKYLIRNESEAKFATDDALDLLSRMLVYAPEKRISARDALMHPYFRPVRRPAAAAAAVAAGALN
mmetsp:Transcript_24629/g.41065  ORF Transcript_24629/g.41065 Transcript_24629/m.41065 type:complete len:419 (-) Transcript_24629:258-1514(-)